MHFLVHKLFIQCTAGPYRFKSLVNFHLTSSHRYLCLKTAPTVARSVGWQPRQATHATAARVSSRPPVLVQPRRHTSTQQLRRASTLALVEWAGCRARPAMPPSLECGRAATVLLLRRPSAQRLPMSEKWEKQYYRLTAGQQPPHGIGLASRDLTDSSSTC